MLNIPEGKMNFRILLLCVYQVISSAEILLTLLFIKRVVYLEPALTDKNVRAWYLAAFFLASFLTQVCIGPGSEGTAFLIPALFFCIHIFLTRKAHRIAGIGLLIPTMGFLTGFLALLFGIPYTLSGNYPKISSWTYAVDVIFWMGAGLLYWNRQKIRHRLRLDAPYRKLGRWEEFFLNISGVFLLAAGFMIIAVKEMGMEEKASRIFAGFGCFAVILLEISAIVLIQQENKKDYFQYMTTVGEHYLKTELNHFRAYQEREENIRRFRHDMKNHFLCLGELAGRGDLEKVKAYIQELQEELGETGRELRTGNEIADAILNEKNLIARAGDIEIRLEGKLPDPLTVRATDICTIFANALDNALESLMNQEESPKWISVYIRQQGGILSLTFQNPVSSGVILPPGTTAKKEKEDHGLGILNMIYAAEKYKGRIYRQILEKDKRKIYSLEILLFLQDFPVQ